MNDKTEHIRNFVNYGFTMNIRMIIKCSVGLNILPLFTLVYGIVCGGGVLLISLSMLSLSIICSIVNLIIAGNSHKEKNCVFLLTGILCVQGAVVFLLWTLMMVQLLADTFYYSIVLIIVHFIIVAVYLGISILLIRNGIYNNRRSVQKKNATVILSLGVSLGYIFPRVFLRDISQELALSIMIVGSFLLSVIMSFGYSHFLKYYYIKKYSLNAEIRIMKQ
jgi:hypothetical protein